MAVWMIGQPPQGLLVERCLAQLVDTVLGAVAGLVLLLPGATHPAASMVVGGMDHRLRTRLR